MKVFTKDDKMSRLIITETNLLPVMSRFNIRLGFKEKTIDEVCLEHGANTDFFLAIVNTYINENYFPERKLQAFSPLLLINYLRQTHKYYIEYVIPKIEQLLIRVIESEAYKTSDMKLIGSFYQNYKAEILLHFEKEEKETFPYIEYIVKHNNYPESPKRIYDYGQEHTDVEEKLSDLKNLVIKYLDADYDANHMNDFLHTLYHFEQDLNDHARIEDAILVKQVIAIETQLNLQNK
ncbi:MAG: hemerythrin domain-containing protein [Mangrovibacterium sp.]